MKVLLVNGKVVYLIVSDNDEYQTTIDDEIICERDPDKVKSWMSK
jgi:hypothetical protein